MLLRIVPQMFEDERFECITIREVYNELTQTTKFKNKYPWAASMRNKLKSLPSGETGKDEVKFYQDAIKILNDNGTIDQGTDRLFNLSREDIKVMACALALGHSVTSGDGGLVRFLEQEFKDDFKGNISPLELINTWLEKGLLSWDDTKHEYIAEWNANEEHAQPKKEIAKFTKLTRRSYPGP